MILDCCTDCNHLEVSADGHSVRTYCNKEQCDVIHTKCMSHHAVKIYIEAHKIEKLEEQGLTTSI